MLHGVHLPDLVRTAGARAWLLGHSHGRGRCQLRLLQPALQGAGGRNMLFGVKVEQVQADAAVRLSLWRRIFEFFHENL